RLEAACALAVDRDAGDARGEAGRDRRLTGDVTAGRTARHGRTEEHVIDLGRIELGALKGGLDDVRTHRSAVRVVERTLERPADGGARGRDDDGFGHGCSI